MRRVRLFSFAAVLAASTSIGGAADLGQRKPVLQPVPVDGGYSWAGFYFGAQAGYSWGRDKTKEYLTSPFTFIGLQNSYNTDGYTGGLYGGGNAQYGNTVVGVEADVDFGKIKGRFVDPPAPPFNPGGAGRTEVKVQGSIRGRVGYSYGSTLVYATAGLAVADHTSQYWNWAGTSETFSRVVTGYTVGAGVEYALSPNFTVRGEYRFTEYERFKNNSVVVFPGFTGTQRPYLHTTHIGVAYKF